MADPGKTEKPTPRRLRRARREGQFPRTPDAATWIGLAAGASMVPRTAAAASAEFRQLLHRLPVVATEPTPRRAVEVLSDVPLGILRTVLPLSAVAAGAAVLAWAAQGVYPSGKGMRPKLSRMDPRQGLRRMFGPRAAWEAVKSLLKVLVIAAVVLILGRDLVRELAGTGPHSVAATIARARAGFETIIWAAAAAGLALALADYAYQRHTVMKQLRMTPREIKDEYKQTEGDPAVKNAIRSRQLALSRNRMLSAVADADVVLVNPTHLAVALKYVPGQGAPRVVAKGAGAVADKIRERAMEHRVPVVEDKPLARAIYRICELNEEVPTELYKAVARILAFVMRAARPRPGDRPRRPATPTPVPEQLPSRGELRARRARELRSAVRR
jgi:flagellar biosynthetic protein FlhB